MIFKIKELIYFYSLIFFEDMWKCIKNYSTLTSKSQFLKFLQLFYILFYIIRLSISIGYYLFVLNIILFNMYIFNLTLKILLKPHSKQKIINKFIFSNK